MPLVSKKLHCSVSGCDSDSKKNPPIKLYCFPRNKNRLAKWKLFCNNKKIEQRNDSYIRRHCRVCSKHFIKDDLRIITEHNFRLAPEAIPRIRYPAENDLVQLDEVDFMDEENYDNSKDPSLLPKQDPSFPFSEDPTLLSPIDNDSQDPILISSHDSTHLVSHIPSPSFDRRKRASKYPEVNEDFEKCHEGLNNVSIVKADLKSLRRNSFLASPKMKMLYKFTKKQEKDLKRLQRKYSKQNFSVEQVKRLSLRDLNEISNLSKRMAHTRYILKNSQIRCFLRTSKGRKWSLAEKVSALSLFSKMPKMYNTLRCIFVLPSKGALSSTLCKMNLSTGINYNVFEALMKKAKTMSVCEKHAILIFGKMRLRENLAYDSAQDRVFGFEDNGAHGRSIKRATHVLMFIACGLVQQWVQPVAYYLLPKNKVSTTLLKNHVTDVIIICNAVGLKITATMCDSRPSFVQTLKNLGATPQDPTITIEGEKVITLFDPSHLLICTRNAIQKHDVAVKGDTDGLEFEGVASWQHIEDAYKRDKLFGVFRFLWRLTDNHLNPASCKEKMETKMAAQVLSHSVAAVLYSYVSAGQMISEAMPSAHLVEFLDQLFDSFSGTQRKYPDGKKIKCHMTNKSPHLEFWKKAYHFIDSWKFIEKNHTEELRVVRPSVQDGWLLTVSGIQRLWEVVSKLSSRFGMRVSFMVVGNINQGKLKNVFHLIRSYCANSNPTATQFVGALKTCILNTVEISDADNGCCGQKWDNVFTVTNLQSLVDDSCSNLSTAVDGIDALLAGIESDHLAPVVDLSSVVKVSGHITSKLLAKKTCESCKAGILNESPEERWYSGSCGKEFEDDSIVPLYPSEELVRCVGRCATLVENFLGNQGYMDDLSKHAFKFIVQEVNFYWLKKYCSKHFADNVLSISVLVCRIMIPRWCKEQNQALKKT